MISGRGPTPGPAIPQPMTTQILDSGARLTPFLLPTSARAGVLVLPGGGYSHLATQHEGHAIGEWLNARGYDAWMLEYRVISAGHEVPLSGKPLEDVGLAVAAIRASGRGEKLGIWVFRQADIWRRWRPRRPPCNSISRFWLIR